MEEIKCALEKYLQVIKKKMMIFLFLKIYIGGRHQV